MSFSNYLQQKNITPKIIRHYEREVNKYIAWLAILDLTDIQANQKDLLNYLQHLKTTRNISNSTQSKYLCMLKHYCQYLAKTHHIKDISHFIKIRGAKQIHIQQAIRSQQIEMLCDAYYDYIQHEQPTNQKLFFYQKDNSDALENYKRTTLGYYIGLTLMAHQALTSYEVLELKKENFDLHKGTISVKTHLRGNARTLKLESSQIGVVISFYTGAPEALLIPNRNHLEIISDTLKKLLPAFKNFRQLRTTKIVQWIKAHGMRQAQVLAGHKYIEATERFMVNEVESLQNDMDKFHPLQ